MRTPFLLEGRFAFRKEARQAGAGKQSRAAMQMGLAMAASGMLAFLLSATTSAFGQEPSKPSATTADQTMYERCAELKKDPRFAAKLAEPARRIHELDWLLGDWTAEAVVFATQTTPEWREQSRTSFRQVGDAMIASDDLATVLLWDPFALRWRSFGAEPPVSPLASSLGQMEDGTLVHEGDVRLFGEVFHLRQTLTRDGSDGFEIVNEERLKSGRYQAVDAYRYTRTSAAK